MNIGLLFDLTILVIVIGLLALYIKNNIKRVQNQPVLKIGNFPIFSMIMVRTKWGLRTMDWLADNAGPAVRGFGYLGIIIGILGLIFNLYLLGLMVQQLFIQPELQQVGLVLPFTNVPGLGYLSFTHWIIAIAFLAAIHEFAHGVVARAHKIPVKSSGIAVFNVFHIPLIPAAFVEPDEKKFPKRQHRQQHSVLAAGPAINIVVAIPLLFVLLWFSSTFFATAGFAFSGVNESFPAGQAGVESDVVYNYINGVPANNAIHLITNLSQLSPGDNITIGTDRTPTGDVREITITTTVAPDNESRAYLGVVGLATEVEVIPPAKSLDWLVIWTEELIRWLFLFNFLIGLMNLMPLYITDGGQIIKLYATKLIKDEKRAMSVYKWVCSITFYIILAAFIVPMLVGLF